MGIFKKYILSQKYEIPQLNHAGLETCMHVVVQFPSVLRVHLCFVLQVR